MTKSNFETTNQFLAYAKSEEHRKAARLVWQVKGEAMKALAAVDELLRLDPDKLSSYEQHALVTALSDFSPMLSSWEKFREGAYAAIANGPGGVKKAEQLVGSKKSWENK